MNSLNKAGKGFSSLCTRGACYQSFDAVVPRVTSFFDCDGGCVNEAAASCQQYCGTCATLTSCSSCVSGYAFAPATDYCVFCNSSNLTVFDQQCFSSILHCEEYSSGTVCGRCQSNYSGGNCTVCSIGYFHYNADSGGTDCGALVQYCLKYAPSTVSEGPNCSKCIS